MGPITRNHKCNTGIHGCDFNRQRAILQTDRHTQIDRQTDRNTLLPYRVGSFFVFVCMYTAYVVLVYCEHGGANLMGLRPSP